MRVPMVLMTSSMQDSGLVLRKSLLGGPLVGPAFTLHVLSSRQGKKISGCRDGPSERGFTGKFDCEGNLSPGSSAVFFWIALVRQQQLPKPQLCSQRRTTGRRHLNKQRKERSPKAHVNVFLRGETFNPCFKDWPTECGPSGFRSHHR